MALGAGTHTRRLAYRLRGQKQFQETRRTPTIGWRTPGLKSHKDLWKTPHGINQYYKDLCKKGLVRRGCRK